ncbi:MAG TPA: tRNA lysidine(34) synthetase TilS [Spirochaetota bacterium]|nr:tRNA lysidine(34) synthetase TilS [Spirochaetota bacterium]HOM38799.1 tRNA lysidine(34) synthetase TilS [Spirochaetota bacterium]HPQ49857.1 tRNA lysidine(34) synthetase TilS [Spirochaetota bacterium]
MQFIRNILDNVYSCYSFSEKTLLSYSCGPDSTFLFYMLLELKRENKIDFQVFYLNHLLRSLSFEEESYVSEICNKFNIRFYIERFDVKEFARKNKISFEEAGRIIRYRYLEKIREENSLDSITTAHNADDNIENFFLRLFKGSGLSGLSPMKKRDGILVRPILDLDKNFILKFLDENSIKYYIDETNSDIKYERNRIRNIIIPVIKEHFSSFATKIKEVQSIIEETKEFIDKNVIEFREGYFEIYLDINKIKNNDKVIIKNSVINALKRLSKNYYISYEQLNNLVEVIKSWDFKGHKIFLQTKNYSIILSYDKIFITENIFYKQFFLDNERIEHGKDLTIGLISIKNRSGTDIFIKRPYIGYRLIIGDKKKKLHDFLVDKKIHYHHRQYTFLVLDDCKVKAIIIPTLGFIYKLPSYSNNLIDINLLRNPYLLNY